MVCFQGCFQGLCGLPSCAAWFGIFKTIWARTRAPMRRRTSALAAAAALATASALAATFAVAAASALSAARALAAACAFAAASALAATSALAAAAALASPPPPSPPQPSPSPPSPRGTPSVQFPLLEPRFSTLLMAVAWPRPAPPSRCGEARRTGESCWTRPRRSGRTRTQSIGLHGWILRAHPPRLLTMGKRFPLPMQPLQPAGRLCGRSANAVGGPSAHQQRTAVPRARRSS